MGRPNSVAKLAGLVFSAACVASLIYFARAQAELQCEYEVTVRGDDGVVAVSVCLAGAQGQQLRLRPLIADRLVNVTDLTCTDDGGRIIKVAPDVEYFPTGDIQSRFTSYVIEPAQSKRFLRYTVRPTANKAVSPCGEPRNVGYVCPEWAVLSGGNFLLVPEAPRLNVSITCRITGTSSLELAKRDFRGASADELLSATWCLSRVASTTTNLRSGVRLEITAEVAESIGSMVNATLDELTDWLGKPIAPLVVHLVPSCSDGHRVAQLTAIGDIVVDTDRTDMQSTREFIRSCVPAWFGYSRVELEGGLIPDGWALLGLAEYLGYVLPQRLGLDGTDGRLGLESTWVRGMDFHDVDITDLSHWRVGSTRIKGAALWHDLELQLGSCDELRRVVREIVDNLGPEGLFQGNRSLVAKSGMSARASSHGTALGFENRWHLDLRATPEENLEESAAAHQVTLLYTSNTAGRLENCGCKVSQEGGVSRRAAALRELRRGSERPLLLDLGNFLPLEEHASDLSPSLMEEAQVYVDCMRHMNYDAVIVGPDDIACGTETLAAALKSLNLPVLSGGIRSPMLLGASNSAQWNVGGVPLTLVGLTERIEEGWLREAQDRNTVGVGWPYGADAIAADLNAASAKGGLLCVVGRLSPMTIRELAARGDVGLIITGGAVYDMSDDSFGWLGNTLVLYDHVQNYGLNVAKLEVADARVVRAEYSQVRLPRTAPVDPDIQMVLDSYYAVSSAASRQLDPGERLFGWDDSVVDGYVGSNVCAGCHAKPFAQWKTTPHATALETLTHVRRDNQARCVKCHVVGLGYSTGYDLAHPQPDSGLAGVGCENCHGPGLAHTASPRTTPMRRAPLQKSCLECHNEEHSEAFTQRLTAAYELVRH